MLAYFILIIVLYSKKMCVFAHSSMMQEILKVLKLFQYTSYVILHNHHPRLHFIHPTLVTFD